MTEDQFFMGISILIPVLVISMALCSLRLYLGPDMPNRTIAFDLIAVHGVGIFALVAINSGYYVLLEGTFVTAVLGFLGTLMFARFLERSQVSQRKPAPPSEEKSSEQAGVTPPG